MTAPLALRVSRVPSATTQRRYGLRSAASQTLISPVEPPEASNLPSGLYASPLDPLLSWPSNSPIGLLRAASARITVLSSLADASNCPLGEKATLLTLSR